ncbi:MAG: DNA-binding protein [Clostridia bacterium]|nr:DNA-binding protein [Clostridia bacterium]
MEKGIFMTAEEVANDLNISKSFAYKIIQQLNSELKEKGYLTISGRVNRQYLLERVCYGAKTDERS